MKTINKYIIYVFAEIYRFITYYLSTIISRHIDYFHYKVLSFFAYPIFTIDRSSGTIGNKCYGNLWAIKNAVKGGFSKKCMIEHGLYFGEFVIEEECISDSIDTIYTYSDYRKNAIINWFDGKLDKRIITVGPYIIYANHFKQIDELKKIKKKLGRVLLVFPSHPSPEASFSYNLDELLDEIDIVAKRFDTVLVSLFWLDIKKGNDKYYLDRGYTVVCSGIRSDRWFLSRQKDLLWLADYSMSNDIGTHIGYSIAMGVPHYLFKQKLSLKGKGAEYMIDKYNQIRIKEYNELIGVFGCDSEIITSDQLDVIKKYWGHWT